MTDWIPQQIATLKAKYGDVPPPWIVLPETHPYDLCWRMGTGEAHVKVFSAWWDDANFSEAHRIDYFRKWSPPPRWLEWTIEAIWDLDTSDLDDPDEFDYSPYFAQLEALGFGTQAEFERDMNDPKWFGGAE